MAGSSVSLTYYESSRLSTTRYKREIWKIL